MGNGFKAFLKEAGMSAKAYMDMTMKNAESSSLDEKTQELAYIAVLAATGKGGGLPFHVAHAKELGATREEVKSAVLVGLPTVGMTVIEVFDIALNSYDAV